ncbi:hypothetical protein ACFE04_021275 [Oxalis oulophora]
MEQNRVLCTSVKYSDLNVGTMTLPKAWGYSSPALLQSEIVFSLENGVSAAIKVKTGSSGNKMSFQQFLLRHNISHDFRMEFQNVGGNKFYVRIRDTQGVEIDYEIREVDNSRSYLSNNKGTPTSMCKMFGEEEFAKLTWTVLKCECLRSCAVHFNKAVPGIWGNHFLDLYRGVVYLLVSDGRRWAIETEKLNDRTIRLFSVEFQIEYERDDEGDVEGVQKSNVSIADNRQDNRSPYEEEIVMYGDTDDSDSMSDEVDSGEVLVMDGDSDDSDSMFDVVESGDNEMGNDEAQSNETGPRNIWYYRGYLIGGNFGANGTPGFMMKMTNLICTRFQPMYISRSFVRTHLLPRGKQKVATMLVGPGVKVQYVKESIMFRLVDSDADAYSVTFGVTKMND